MKRRNARPVLLSLGLLVAASSLTLTGCDDGIAPLIWADRPDTVELYSLARTEFIDRPSAYGIVYGATGPVVIERLSLNPFGFDFAVSEDEAGNFLLLPTGVFPDASIQPGILVDDTATFNGIRRAPRDGYITDEPVEAETGVVYVLRSRQTGNGCYYYGKMEILELDPTGIATLQVLANINCSNRSLVPNAPLDDDDEDDEGGA